MIFGEASTLASVLVLSHFNAACNFFVLPLLSLEEIGKERKACFQSLQNNGGRAENRQDH